MRALEVVGSLALLILAVAGAIGWIVIGIQSLSYATDRKRYREQHPLPRLQLWMQDLLIVAFCYGAYLAYYFSPGGKLRGDSHQAALLGAWVFLCMSCGLYFALDVCRRSLRLQGSAPRALFVAACLVFTTVTMLLPAWLSWRAWRFALWKAYWALGNDVAERLRAREELPALRSRS